MKLFVVLFQSMLLTGVIGASAFAGDTGTGFLEDYSLLKESPENNLTKYYLAPGASDILRKSSKILVDHPEMFIAADSPYQGFKPAHQVLIAEALRTSVSEALADDFDVVDKNGEGVLTLSLALVDVSITKGRFHVAGLTPIGLVFQGTRAVASSSYDNAVRNTSLQSLKIEGQLHDSNGKLLGEFVDDFGSTKKASSWTELQTEMGLFGSVIDCQLSNAAKAEGDRIDCRAKDATVKQ